MLVTVIFQTLFLQLELTEREEAILSITSDQSYVFDFDVDNKYKEVVVWVEKYETGKLANDKIIDFKTVIENNGSII
ncbi:hypothetical protein MUN88_00695 [Gracilibacillus caseinilyticus]|uniref:Uncharacterized protein n=1 Tax=Gracilibacillus caseinilyticus TaxID=2932256 RepID=A0ABY4EWC1_9BACI|nr:hypothetical protein [Gracilibacillus caseinilyticus]UOQ48715.1 hypothetical protein MUN88_00695 [Gracilibacillus caseinilyticus]